MITVIVVVIFAAIIAIDFIPAWKTQGIKVKYIYGAMMLVSFCILILVTLDVPVPSPTVPIIDAIDALFPQLNP